MRPVFLHGLGQTPASWDKTVACLGLENRADCLDLCSRMSGGEAAYQNLYAAFSLHCDGTDGALDLCGLSLGGVMALNYAIDRPQKVRSLVLIAAQYQTPKKLLRFQNLIFRFAPSSMFQQTGFGKADFLKLCRTMMELDFSDSLSRVTCPVLVLCGEKDSANKKAAIALAERLPHARLQIIPGAGHEVNLEAPEALAKALQDFYNQIG